LPQTKKSGKKQGGAQQHDWNFPVQTFFAKVVEGKNATPALLLYLSLSSAFY